MEATSLVNYPVISIKAAAGNRHFRVEAGSLGLTLETIILEGGEAVRACRIP
jgi:hypothetical protein